MWAMRCGLDLQSFLLCEAEIKILLLYGENVIFRAEFLL